MSYTQVMIRDGSKEKKYYIPAEWRQVLGNSEPLLIKLILSLRDNPKTRIYLNPPEDCYVQFCYCRARNHQYEVSIYVCDPNQDEGQLLGLDLDLHAQAEVKMMDQAQIEEIKSQLSWSQSLQEARKIRRARKENARQDKVETIPEQKIAFPQDLAAESPLKIPPSEELKTIKSAGKVVWDLFIAELKHAQEKEAELKNKMNEGTLDRQLKLKILTLRAVDLSVPRWCAQFISALQQSIDKVYKLIEEERKSIVSESIANFNQYKASNDVLSEQSQFKLQEVKDRLKRNMAIQLQCWNKKKMKGHDLLFWEEHFRISIRDLFRELKQYSHEQEKEIIILDRYRKAMNQKITQLREIERKMRSDCGTHDLLTNVRFKERLSNKLLLDFFRTNPLSEQAEERFKAWEKAYQQAVDEVLDSLQDDENFEEKLKQSTALMRLDKDLADYAEQLKKIRSVIDLQLEIMGIKEHLCRIENRINEVKSRIGSSIDQIKLEISSINTETARFKSRLKSSKHILALKRDRTQFLGFQNRLNDLESILNAHLSYVHLCQKSLHESDLDSDERRTLAVFPMHEIEITDFNLRILKVQLRMKKTQSALLTPEEEAGLTDQKLRKLEAQLDLLEAARTCILHHLPYWRRPIWGLSARRFVYTDPQTHQKKIYFLPTGIRDCARILQDKNLSIEAKLQKMQDTAAKRLARENVFLNKLINMKRRLFRGKTRARQKSIPQIREATRFYDLMRRIDIAPPLLPDPRNESKHEEPQAAEIKDHSVPGLYQGMKITQAIKFFEKLSYEEATPQMRSFVIEGRRPR